MYKKIFVELTNRCNLACDFCLPTRRTKADMELSALAGLLPQLVHFTKHLSLHVLGEPLLYPQLGQVLGLCHEHGLRVNLTTNGSLLPWYSRMLLSAPALRQINISLHSVSGHLGGLGMTEYLDGVMNFSRLAAAAGKIVSLRIWDLSLIQREEGPRQHGDLLSRLEKFFCLSQPLAATVIAGQGIKLIDNVYLSQKELFVWPTLAGPVLAGRGTCRGGRDHVGILVDGTVVPCCLDGEGAVPLGNVFARSFAEIVAGERAVRIKKGFEERWLVEELCQRCSYRERF